MKQLRRILTAAAVTAALVGSASPAAAAKPDIERIEVDVTFPDEFLTEECGVPVTTTVEGTIIMRTYEREGTGPLFLVTVNVRLTLTSGDNVVRIRDVGADLVRRTPDGTVIVSVIGQVAFGFKGVLKFNETTGEVILEPKPSRDLDRVCAALTA